MSKEIVVMDGKTEKEGVTHLTSTQFAHRVKVHPGTCANWRSMGFGPKWIKFGKHVLYPLKEVEEWEEKNLQKNTVYGKH